VEAVLDSGHGHCPWTGSVSTPFQLVFHAPKNRPQRLSRCFSAMMTMGFSTNFNTARRIGASPESPEVVFPANSNARRCCRRFDSALAPHKILVLDHHEGARRTRSFGDSTCNAATIYLVESKLGRTHRSHQPHSAHCSCLLDRKSNTACGLRFRSLLGLPESVYCII